MDVLLFHEPLSNPFICITILERSESMQTYLFIIKHTTFESSQLSRITVEYSMIMNWCNFLSIEETDERNFFCFS